MAECKCGQKAVYLRRYEGNAYCSQCLKEQVEKRFLAEAKLIGKDDVVAVALSGGKDSSVLLHLMSKFCRRNKIRMFAVTVDEGVSGYRDRSMECAEKMCRSLGIDFYTTSFSSEFGVVIDEIRGKSCTYCGVFRRYLLNKKARELGATKLAIGHNMDDEAQSAFMNFLRGDVGRMARPGNSRFVQRIKPLAGIPEKEIVVYANVEGVEYYDGECPHSFDNVRRDVQAILNDLEDKYPGTKLQIANFQKKIIPIHGAGINRCSICEEPSSGKICKACELLENLGKLAGSELIKAS